MVIFVPPTRAAVAPAHEDSGGGGVDASLGAGRLALEQLQIVEDTSEAISDCSALLPSPSA